MRTQRSDLALVVRQDVADTIYEIDRISEEVIARWFEQSWPDDVPVEVVMEGVNPAQALTFPAGADLGQTRLKLILDPIDGTRGIMYDKRPAWFLARAALEKGTQTAGSDIEVDGLVELPTS